MTTYATTIIDTITEIIENDLNEYGYLCTILSNDFDSDDIAEAVNDLIALGLAVEYDGEVMAPDYRDEVVAEYEGYMDAVNSAWYARWN